MPVERVRAYLREFALDAKIQEFKVSSATVSLAAGALGVEPARIAKSIALRGPEGCLLLVSAGDVRINNSKFKARFACKPRLLSPEETLAATGYPTGGVCPFALPAGVGVFLDISLQRFSTIFPACGSASSGIELDCAQLYLCSRALAWVDVCA
jgi:prolyl-tRNA editing enzyme YbaK/EbsC (Cys-tRNA(Pro) deacylase)